MGETDRRGPRTDRDGRTTADVDAVDEAFEESSQGPLTDWIRRFAALGLSSFFTTESAIRKAFGDTVPQEWVDFLTDQGDRSRQELFDRVAAEFGRVLERVDIEDLLERLATGRTIEVEAKVRIGPRTDATDESPDEAELRVRSRKKG